MTLTPRLALMLAVPPLMWAGNAVVGRMVVSQVAPLKLNLLRWLLALLLLLPLGWRVFASAPRRAQIAQRWPHLALLALLGVGSYNALQYLALTTSTALNITLIAASSPLWMLLVGMAGYGVHPRPRELVGAALSLLGVATVLSRGDAAALARVHFVTGDLLILVAVACWAAYSWMLARPPLSMQAPQRPDWTWAEFLCIQIVLGLLWAGAGAVGEVALGPPQASVRWTPWLLAGLAFVATGPSIVAYRLWGLGVAQAGPAVAAFFANLTPLFAAMGSAALLGEWPRPFHAVAFVFIVAGIVVSARK